MNNNDQIKQAAQEALSTFDIIEKTAAQKAAGSIPVSGAVLASGMNGIAGSDPVANLNSIASKNRDAYLTLTQEPAISMVVYLDENDIEHTAYISRSTSISLPGSIELAGYSSPKGRLAAMPTGEEVTLNIAGQKQKFEIVKKIKFKTVKNDNQWDSINSVFVDEYGSAKTVRSFLKLLDQLGQSSLKSAIDLDDLSGLDALLAGADDEEIIDGLKHEIRQAMALRDQPILDQLQDEIFRMAINSQLIILGPPGTGKTTTLIKRLGQKLNLEHLDEPERVLIDKRANEIAPHDQDWMMFTPTDLLKHFVKEAFNREMVPASDERIKTWDSYRIHLARNVLDLLQSGGKKGFIYKPESNFIQPNVIENPTGWYESFKLYHEERLVEFLRNGLTDFKKASDSNHTTLTKELEKIVSKLAPSTLVGAAYTLNMLDGKLQEALKSLKDETDTLLKQSLAIEYNKDHSFVTELGKYVDALTTMTEDEDEDELDDDSEELTKAKTTAQKIQAIYNNSIRSIARSRYQKRKLSPKGRPAQIASWLGDRLPADDVLNRIGHLSAQQNALRQFIRLPARIIKDIPKHYRSFRKDTFRDSLWYQELPAKPAHIDGYELDLLVLTTLQSARQLLAKNWIQSRLDDAGFAKLNTITTQLKSQILVDEATDFSPLQLASMYSLTSLETCSFFACGDFNQRITSWGTRSEEQFNWAVPQLNTRSITTVYRQSQKLNDFAKGLLESTEGDLHYVGQPPEQMNHIGVSPAMMEGITDLTDKAHWLAQRINEVILSVQSNEALEQVIPSIAILVCDESEVSPMADALNEHLEELNLRAVACLKGQSLGEDNDVRVFDVQHIKGLEFEAVFFVDIDQLAKKLPDLFDKYLYVGATRAATYFGITAETTLPERIEDMRSHFVDTF